MKKLLVTVAAFGLAGGPAFAQMADFATADADASGAVSFEEAAAALPDKAEEDISAADADGSGDLSQEEYDALAAG